MAVRLVGFPMQSKERQRIVQQIIEVQARMAELRAATDPASASIPEWIELYSELEDLEQHLADGESAESADATTTGLGFGLRRSGPPATSTAMVPNRALLLGSAVLLALALIGSAVWRMLGP